MKPMGYKKAIELMRKPGVRLLKMYTNKNLGGFSYFIVPGGAIDPSVAEKIKQHPLVHSGRDGLFPQHDQTWRMGTDADVLPSVTEAS